MQLGSGLPRCGGILILAYGIFHGRYALPRDIFLTRPSRSHLHGHDLKLSHRSFYLARRKVAFLCELWSPGTKLHLSSSICLQWRSSRTDWMSAGRPSLVWMTLDNCLPFLHGSAPFVHLRPMYFGFDFGCSITVFESSFIFECRCI